MQCTAELGPALPACVWLGGRCWQVCSETRPPSPPSPAPHSVHRRSGWPLTTTATSRGAMRAPSRGGGGGASRATTSAGSGAGGWRGRRRTRRRGAWGCAANCWGRWGGLSGRRWARRRLRGPGFAAPPAEGERGGGTGGEGGGRGVREQRGPEAPAEQPAPTRHDRHGTATGGRAGPQGQRAAAPGPG